MAQFFFTTIAFLSLTVEAAEHHMTLVSQNQVFEFSFFSPIANRNHPITASEAPVLMISKNASLVISSGKSTIWLANSSRLASNPVLQLLDSGNLVLVDNTSATEGYLWQSFDYPTDTMLPGMKIVDDNEAGVVRNMTSWRNPDVGSDSDSERGKTNISTWTVEWDMLCGGLQFPSAIYKPELVFREERLISVGESYQSSLLVRSTLDTSGVIMRYTMNLRKDKWNLATMFPLDTYDEYASCGPNCICRPDRPIRCECLKRFSPMFQKDWNLQDWSAGCTRTKPLKCNGGDGFQQVIGIKFPDMSRFRLNKSMSLGECKVECLKQCGCTAYANPIISNGSTGCLMWFGDLIDTKQLPSAYNNQHIYIRMSTSELGKSFRDNHFCTLSHLYTQKSEHISFLN